MSRHTATFVALTGLVASLALPHVFAQSPTGARTRDTLDIYSIDVEGGQSTLIVTPRGESLLIDAGYAAGGETAAVPGDPAKARDAQRVLAAARDAGVTAIDVLLVTHFHPDHVGGVPEVSRLLPIRTFVDHDVPAPDVAPTPGGAVPFFDAYARVRSRGTHVIAKPGDRLPITGVEALVVSSSGEVIDRPIAGGGTPNAACRSAARAVTEQENPRSTGVRIQFDRFRLIDLGDLSGVPLHRLMCPIDRLGPADVVIFPHHGNADVQDAFVLGAAPPRVTLVNNGLRKGGGAPTLTMLQAIKATEVWQLHRSENTGATNTSDERVANIDASSSHWIKVSARADGSFIVTNGRTGKTVSYPVP